MFSPSKWLRDMIMIVFLTSVPANCVGMFQLVMQKDRNDRATLDLYVCVSKGQIWISEVQSNVLNIKLCNPLLTRSEQKWVFQPSANRTNLELMFFTCYSSNWKEKIYWTVKQCVVSGGTFCWLEHRGEDFFIEIKRVPLYGGELRGYWRRISRRYEPISTELSAKTFCK